MAHDRGPLARLPSLQSGSQQVLLSIEIFERYLGSDVGLAKLEVVSADDVTMEAMAEQFLVATDYSALWLLLLLELGGTEEELLCVSELFDSFKIAKKIPTGVRLAHKTLGNFPLSIAALEACKSASDEARRIFLIMCDAYCQGKQVPVDENSARMKFITATMAAEGTDCMKRFLSSRSIAFILGISVDIQSDYAVTLSVDDVQERKRLARVNLQLLYDNFTMAVKAFCDTHSNLRTLHRERALKLEEESDAVHEYKLMLYAATGFDDEETMPVSINHYLKDNEDLRTLYNKNDKKRQAVIDIEARYAKELLYCMHLVPTVRFSCALLVYAMGLAIPTHICAGGTPRSSEEASVLEHIHGMLANLPWASAMRQFFEVEREIYGAVYTRMLAALACLLFPDMQEALSADEFEMRLDEDTAYDEHKKYFRVVTCPSLVRKALNDLLDPALSWKTNDEEFPEVEPWMEKATLHRPVRHCRLDTRIATALVYWAGHHNSVTQERVRNWKVHITDESSPLMWPQLVVRSDKSQEASPFDHNDGSEPFIQREYKEYHTGLADQGTYDFLILEMQRVEEQEQVYSDNACNILKLCTDFRVSANYGNMFSQRLFHAIITASPFNFEGGGMHSLRCQHPLSIVLQLSTHWSNPSHSVSHILMEKPDVLITALFKSIHSSAKRGSSTENILLFNIGLQLLGNIVQGPCPIQRHPSLSALFKDDLLEPISTLPIDTLRSNYQAECRETMKLVANVVFQAKPADLCPVGILLSPAISCAMHFICNLTFVLPPTAVLDFLSTACVTMFKANLWHVSTATPYQRHQMDEDEREELEADKDDPVMQKRIAAKKEVKRQSYANFFLFSIEGGLYSLANHYLKEDWNLPKDVLVAYWADLEPVSNEYRCLVLELVNVMSFFIDDLLHLIAKQVNFLAGVMLDALELVSKDEHLPQLSTLKKQPRTFFLNGEFINLRIAEQILRLSTRVVNLGRVGDRKAGGRVLHASDTNEFILYFALSDTGTSLAVATKLMEYASTQSQALSLAHTKPNLGSDVKEKDSWEEYIEHCMFTKLRDVALVVVSFLHEMCTGRIELQSKVELQCSSLFHCFPRLLAQSNFLQGAVLQPTILFPDDRFYHFHVGIARRISMLLQGLCKRHEGCTELVQTSGCMEALCAGLNDCMDGALPLEEWIMRSWSECITKTVETVVSRSIDAWQYCQDVSGISGLFTLIYLGNNTIKKLCVTTFLDHATHEDLNAAAEYIDGMVESDALKNLRILIEIKDDDDLVNLTLTLIKLVVITSKSFRVSSFDPKQGKFFSTVTGLLKHHHAEIQANVCDIFNYFCAEDAAALRSLLVRYDAVKTIQNLASASGQDVFGGGETERVKIQMLAKAAATTIANLTKSEESEFLVGSAPLRPTLVKSGILPSLRS
jgi:hypothetical protein